MTIGAPISDKVMRFFSSPEIVMPIHALKETSYFSRKPYAHQEKAWYAAEILFNLYDAAFFQMGIGTGKTFTAINLARMMHRDKKIETVLIVAPKSLLGTWTAQLDEHCMESFSLCKWDAVKSSTKKWKTLFDDTMQVKSIRFILINIEAFSSMNKKLEEVLKSIFKTNTLLFLDESSTIKTHDSNRTKNLTKAGKKATYKIAMTGTAITKSPLDVFGQVEFLKEKFFGEGHFMFKQRYAIMVDEYGAGGHTHKKVVGYQKLDELIAKVDAISYKVRTEDCIDLPEKIFENIIVELSPKTRKIYDDLKKTLIAQLESGELLSTPSKIAQFTKLRQVVGGFVINGAETEATGETDKLDALVDLVADTDDQVVIFASHRAEIEAMAERLGDDAVTFYGGTDDRDGSLKSFQAGEKRFFVAHPQSGGFGLNLQNSHIMVFYSIITRDVEQVIGRIHRSGQKMPCLYYSLIAKDTIDERLLEIVKRDSDMLRLFEAGDADALMGILKATAQN